MIAEDKLREIDNDGEGLSDWEIEFVESLFEQMDRSGFLGFSIAQEAKIDQIHESRVS